MAQFPALPLWTDSYLADCSHLTFAQHGVYLRLILLMWRSPNCRIPNDDEWIMRKLNCDATSMRKLIRPIIQEFCKTTGNWVFQKRLSHEWQWCREKRKTNTVSAKLRWNKEKDISERSANAMPPHPTHTHKEEEDKKKESINIRAIGVGSLRSNGNGKAKVAWKNGDHVTIADPSKRLGRFMTKIATQLHDPTWATILLATDQAAPGHADALKACKRAAGEIGKGWPRNWPTDGKFFEIIQPK